MRFWIVVAVLLACAGCGGDKTPQKTIPAVSVQSVGYTSSRIAGIRYAGSVKPFTRVDLAFKNGGYVAAIMQVPHSIGPSNDLHAGDRVRKGDILMRLQEGDYLARVAQAQAQYRAGVAAADTARGRFAEARASQAQAVSGVQQARDGLAQAQSQLEEARAGLRQAQGMLTEARAGRMQSDAAYERARQLWEAEAITKPDWDSARATHESTGGKVNEALAGIRSAETKIDAAKAGVTAARSRLQQAQAQVGQADVVVTQASAQVAQADAALQGYSAQVDQARIALEDCRLRSPLDGVVLARNVEVGTLVSPGTVGVSVGETGWLKMVFSVADTEVDRMKVGNNLAIRFEAFPSRQFVGRISSVSPAADPKSRVFDVEISLLNELRIIKPGMIGEVKLEHQAANKEVLVVPLSAIVRSKKDPDGYAVFVLEQSGGQSIARLRDVNLGPAVGNKMTVLGGVRAGEKIVTSGAAMATDGDPVRVVP
ncbi:MAG: efflux RND transporter periplasmic adaptor subunit [Armatimonadetes bacterium]|nr:efflux RND transporter periplasmic adaptor subunit [Armatimonadota bacterium]